MLKTRELDEFLGGFIKEREQSREASEKTLFGVLREANVEYSPKNPAELPDEAFDAAAGYMSYQINMMCIESAQDMARFLLAVKELPDNPSKKEVRKVVALAEKAGKGYLVTVEIIKRALADVDYTYLAEVAVQAGRERDGAGDKE